MKPRNSLPYSQKVSKPCHEPDTSSPSPLICFFMTDFNIILTPTPRSCAFPSDLAISFVYNLYFSSLRTTSSAHHIIFGLRTRKLFGNENIYATYYYAPLDCLTLQSRTDRFSQNISNGIQISSALHPRRAKVPLTQQR